MTGPLLPITFKPDPALTELVRGAVERAESSLPPRTLTSENLGLTLHQIDRTTRTVRMGHLRGDKGMFPASVIKVFWLAFYGHRIERGFIVPTPETERAARDMIVVSSNDATGAIVNLTTGALPGPELQGSEWESWLRARNAANRWFTSLGYTGINVLNRTYNEGPYGREWQAIGARRERRNRLTPDAAARLMTEIALDAVVSPAQCERMRSLLKRPISADGENPDVQSRAYIGGQVPAGTQLWSKAGWTSEVNHDVATFQLQDGRTFTLAIFTQLPRQGEVLRLIAREVIRGIGATPNPDPKLQPGDDDGD